MSEEVVNKVAQSGLVTIDLEELYPVGDRVEFDLKDYLWQGLAIKEKDFRSALKELDWSIFKDKYVALFCSVDSIIPVWAFMLVANYLEPYCSDIIYGDKELMETVLFKRQLSTLNIEEYSDQRVVIKGCSKLPVPVSAYVELTKLLKPVAKSIMYGEPCSTVPIYKKAR